MKIDYQGRRFIRLSMLFLLAILQHCGICQANQDQWDTYFASKLRNPPEQFIVSGLREIATSGSGKVAIDLGCGIGHETKLLLQNKYKVIAVDANARALHYMMLLPGMAKYKSNLTTINSSFETLNFSNLPQVDLIISSFALPFVPKQDFKRVWQNVIATIKPGGHIIVNLFDPNYEFYNNKDNMSFHTKSAALALFNDFNIIDFRVVKSASLQQGENNLYYIIIAQKLPILQNQH